MMRINLLPPEVLERRRYRSWYRYIFIIGTGAVFIVLLVALGLYLSVMQKTSQVQAREEDAQRYAASAEAFRIFEEREQELVAREAVAQQALQSRINMGKLAEEVSLVLPDEVWLDSMTINQDTGMQLAGNTPRSSSQSMDVAYKSLAKTLVRINDLANVYDVWLTSAANTTWQRWAPTDNGQTPLPLNVVGFQATGKVTAGPAVPSAPTTSVPAPPKESGE